MESLAITVFLCDSVSCRDLKKTSQYISQGIWAFSCTVANVLLDPDNVMA